MNLDDELAARIAAANAFKRANPDKHVPHELLDLASKSVRTDRIKTVCRKPSMTSEIACRIRSAYRRGAVFGLQLKSGDLSRKRPPFIEIHFLGRRYGSTRDVRDAVAKINAVMIEMFGNDAILNDDENAIRNLERRYQEACRAYESACSGRSGDSDRGRIRRNGR